MKLSDTQFKMLGNVVDTDDLSRWVVVKEYIPSPTLPYDIRMIFTNFNILKQARILPQDIRIENYRESKIVDLSSTLTEPCPEWSGFMFDFFYKKTIFGVFDWFKGEHICIPQHRNHFLAGPLPLCFEPSELEPEPAGAAIKALPSGRCTMS
jgi:hypothetical protein